MAEEKTEEKKKLKFTREKIYLVLAAVFAVLLISSVATQGFVAFSSISAESAGEKAISFINTEMLSPEQTAVMDKISESNGLYLLNFSISGKKYSTFVSKDGKLLFPQAIDLNMKTETENTEPPATFDAPDSAKPTIELFFMSFCPYGQLAVTGMKSSYDLFGNKISIVPHYVIYDHYCGYGVPSSTCSEEGLKTYCIGNGTLCSMHGMSELNEDIRQLCVYKYYPDKWWSYTDKIISTCQLDNVDTCWEGVAKGVGIDTAKIKECSSKEGETLIAAEKALDDQKGATASPTVFINGAQFSSQLSPEEFKTGICTAFSTKPSECSTALSSTASAASGGCAG